MVGCDVGCMVGCDGRDDGLLVGKDIQNVWPVLPSVYVPTGHLAHGILPVGL